LIDLTKLISLKFVFSNSSCVQSIERMRPMEKWKR